LTKEGGKRGRKESRPDPERRHAEEENLPYSKATLSAYLSGGKEIVMRDVTLLSRKVMSERREEVRSQYLIRNDTFCMGR